MMLFFQGCEEFYDSFTTEKTNISGDKTNPVYQNQQFGKKEHQYLDDSIGPIIGHPRTDADTRLKGTLRTNGNTLVGLQTDFKCRLKKGDYVFILNLETNTTHVIKITCDPETDTSVEFEDTVRFERAYGWVGRINFPWVRNLTPDCYTVMRLDKCDTLKSFTSAIDRSFFLIPHVSKEFNTIKQFLPYKQFNPILGRLNELTVEFLNADGTRYDFMGRDHTLIFRVEHYRQNINYSDF